MPPDDDKNIVAFRLNNLEETAIRNHKDLSSKLDTLIKNQQRYGADLAVAKVQREQLEQDQNKLEGRVERVETSVTNLQISLAERLGPGALAGGGMAVLIQIVAYLIGVI